MSAMENTEPYRVVFFPMEEKYSIWQGIVLIKEWFNSREDALSWILEHIVKENK
jgi:hypothetical protein